MIGSEVFLEVVDQINCLAEDRFVFRTVHKLNFSAEHFRNFREDGCSAIRNEKVGEAADNRVGGDAGESVGSAALETDLQLGGRALGAFVFGDDLNEFLDLFHAGSDFIFFALCDDEAYTLRIVFADIRLQDCDIGVFTSETEYQNAAGIRMNDQVRKNASCVFLVAAHLRASVRMCECMDAVDRTLDQGLCLTLNGLNDVVYAADGRDNPDFIPDTDIAVLADESLERAALCCGLFEGFRCIGILQNIAEVGPDVFNMNMGTGLDFLCGVADDGSVLDDVRVFRKICKCELVSLFDVFNQCHVLAAQGDDFSLFQRLKRDSNVVF